MYVSFYKLSGRPFQLSPDHRFFFESRSHKKAFSYLTYGLSQGEGFIIITGDIGAGKTTLVGHLFAQLDKSKVVAANLVTTNLEAEDTLRMVATSFGIQVEGRDKATLLMQLEAFLLENHRAGKRVLLVVDEAQNLPIRSLEELRMLSNFQHEEKALLQSFLLGQPQFRETIFSDSNLEQLRQRVIATYHLEPVDLEETKAYICHRLGLVDWQGDPEFTDEAFEKIYSHTFGVPRRINTLCSRLLLFGFLEEKHLIDGSAVDEVVKDLMQEGNQSVLPSPASKANGGSAPISEAATEKPEPASEAEMRAEIESLRRRIGVLEKYVRAHDKTIARTLDIMTDWVDGRADEAETG